MTPSQDDLFEKWSATTPEQKLELIGGQLIIGTLAGSRRIAWALLKDYGPTVSLPLLLCASHLAPPPDCCIMFLE